MIKRGTVTIINGRGVILTEKVDKIQIGHIEMAQSIGVRVGKVGDHFFGVREIAQRFPCVLEIIIALPVNQVFQSVSLPLEINNIIYFILLILIPYNM